MRVIYYYLIRCLCLLQCIINYLFSDIIIIQFISLVGIIISSKNSCRFGFSVIGTRSAVLLVVRHILFGL